MSYYDYYLNEIEDNIKSIIKEFRALLPNSTELLNKLTAAICTYLYTFTVFIFTFWTPHNIILHIISYS